MVTSLRCLTLASVLMVMTAVLSCEPIIVAAEPNWKLVWEDGFDGDRLDYSKWECEINAFGGGNQELQIYTDAPENVRVVDGNLLLEVHKKRTDIQGTVRDYSSARVRTKHRGDWQYGKIEVRAKLPKGRGIWPAIWMLPTEERYGGWAASGEIDIMELKGQEPNRVYGTLHYGNAWPNNQFSGEQFVLEDGDFSDGFHTFAVVWKAGEISWYVDNQLYQTQSKWTSSGGPFPAPFDQRFYLVLDVAVGGGFLGPPDASTQFPQRMLVDWVRVYQAP